MTQTFKKSRAVMSAIGLTLMLASAQGAVAQGTGNGERERGGWRGGGDRRGGEAPAMPAGGGGNNGGGYRGNWGGGVPAAAPAPTYQPRPAPVTQAPVVQAPVSNTGVPNSGPRGWGNQGGAQGGGQNVNPRWNSGGQPAPVVGVPNGGWNGGGTRPAPNVPQQGSVPQGAQPDRRGSEGWRGNDGARNEQPRNEQPRIEQRGEQRGGPRGEQGWNGRGGAGQSWNGQGWNGQNGRPQNWGSPGWNGGRNNYAYSGSRNWNHDWRNDSRYNWQGWRSSNRVVFHVGRYNPPYAGYAYRRLSVGYFLDQVFFGNSYRIYDPYTYRLPPAYGPYQWVRYWDDAVLVDIYTGEVVDVLHDFFW
jgi:hypothetical protein